MIPGRYLLRALFLVLVIQPGSSANAQTNDQQPAPYRDPAVPMQRRIEDLLSRMTLEEKVGQMNMPCVYEEGLGRGIPEKMEGVKKFAEAGPGIGPGGGFFTLPNTILHDGTRQQAEFLNSLQRIAIQKTRLGIPFLITEEGTHGLMCPGATIFPEGPALGSTWNPELLRSVYSAAAAEARSIGVHQLFTLVVEPIRDPRLGRNQEAYSEDPYLCSRIAEAIVTGVQGTNLAGNDKVVAGLCHYPGQSQPVSGFERGAMEISERTLREVFLPSWKTGIRKCGALGVMATYPAIDAVPAHASDFLLTKVLREEFGFDGLVLSEGGGIGTLVYEGLAQSQKEAGAMALAAGLDVGISYEPGFMGPLVEGVRQGEVSTNLVDRAVRRILKQKFRLGLFESPYVDVDHALATVHRAEHQALSLQAAREGITLLKNEGSVLPIKAGVKRIAVIGPNADDHLNQLGDYTALRVPQEITTVLKGVRQIASEKSIQIDYVKGCHVTGTNINELDQARNAAAGADLSIVVIGENEWRAPDHQGTDGEGFDSATLELTGLQEDLVKTVQQAGKPVVVVLINGRPLAIRWISQHVPAIVEAWLPGEKGGQAVAEILFGKTNPSGKLPVTFPRHAGQLPVYYNARKSKEYWVKHGWGRPYVDLEPTPLYCFGHGLSYTQFRYDNLRLSAKQIEPAGSVSVSVDITNTGERPGAEVVQLYVEDLVSSVSRPAKELRGFAKVQLSPGETKACSFSLGPDELTQLDRNLHPIVEPGAFRIMIGASAEDIRLKGEFTATDR